MKSFAAVLALATGAQATFLNLGGINAGDQAEEMRQASGSARVDRFDDITPACEKVQCADIECLAPFTLQRRDGQCCPICWAPDHVVSIDRHTVLAGHCTEVPVEKFGEVQEPHGNCQGSNRDSKATCENEQARGEAAVCLWKSGSPHGVDRAAAAPSNCAGAKCFKPVCMPGQKVGHRPGACCNSCK